MLIMDAADLCDASIISTRMIIILEIYIMSCYTRCRQQNHPSKTACCVLIQCGDTKEMLLITHLDGWIGVLRSSIML